MVFVLVLLSLSLSAESWSSVAFGSGGPGLKIVYISTNQFAIFQDEPWTVGPGLIGGYDTRNIDVLFDQSYGLKEKIRTWHWHDIPEQLYAFDAATAFTCDPPDETKVFSIHGGRLIVTGDVYSLARLRYDLSTNQLFLGKLGETIYYWEKGDPRKVFFRPAAGGNATNYFHLPKGMIDLMGATKGIKSRDNIGFVVLRKSAGLFHYSPSEFSFIEVTPKNVKRTK
jgi:hypothetical protein